MTAPSEPPDSKGELGWEGKPGAVWTDLCAVEALPLGAIFRAEVEGTDMLVVRLARGVVAFENRCPHDDQPLHPGPIRGEEIICPRHRARFNLRDGRPRSPPAWRPLRHWRVRISQGRVLLAHPTPP